LKEKATPSRTGARLTLGLALPAVGLGLVTRYVPATTSMTWFTVVLLALLGGVAWLSRRRAR
jgi:LPXTG-motif cell wall-anchored protein